MKSYPHTDFAGTKRWYKISHLHSPFSLHREDGPAVEYLDGSKEWWLNGNLHREDGPAVEYANGCEIWYYHNKQIYCKDNQEFLRMIKLMAFL